MNGAKAPTSRSLPGMPLSQIATGSLSYFIWLKYYLIRRLAPTLCSELSGPLLTISLSTEQEAYGPSGWAHPKLLLLTPS